MSEWIEVVEPVITPLVQTYAVGTRVAMSSGDIFYVDCDPEEVAKYFGKRVGLIQIGSRWVRGDQISMLFREPIPQTQTPERI